MLHTRELKVCQLERHGASYASLHLWQSFSGVGKQLATVAAVRRTKFVQKQCVCVFDRREELGEKKRNEVAGFVLYVVIRGT